MRLKLINKYATGAVHRLYGEILTVDNGCIHIILVVIPVTRSLPKRTLHYLRSGYLKITPPLVNLVPIINEGVAKNHTVGKEERHSGSLVAKCKKPKLLTEFSVVALFCLFNSFKIFRKLGLLCERYTVYTLKHFIFFIAAPICTCYGRKLKRLYSACIGNMRSSAKLGEFRLLIK